MEFIDNEIQHKCSPEAFKKGITHALAKADHQTPKAAPHLMPLKSLQAASASASSASTGSWILKMVVILVVIMVAGYAIIRWLARPSWPAWLMLPALPAWLVLPSWL